MQRVEIRVSNPQGEVEALQVPAVTVRGLAVHRGYVRVVFGDELHHGYSLTHVPSGLCIVQRLPLRAIIALLKHLKPLRLDWDRFKEWPLGLRRQVHDLCRQAEVFGSLCEEFDLDPEWIARKTYPGLN